tara:strand:+ start:316 stop:765 length:450 start_codon:yes stop_codon:yes gene_type:complete
MTSIAKVNALQNPNGNNLINENANTVTLGFAGNQVNIASGAALYTDSLVLNGVSYVSFLVPSISSISPTSITASTPTNVIITGTNFISVPIVDAILTTGSIISANSVTYNSNTSITANFTLTSAGTYYIRVENNSGIAGRSATALLTVI